ncbi:MAG TPA: OmpA family protein [Acidobacteriota bacterium]|jgi:outer membrane protein OmpA-like peptidoglycan-associated protein|nr:OmpA family protein [Acidobacteriota bacterium]
MKKQLQFILCFSLFGMSAFAEPVRSPQQGGRVPVYHVTVVARTTKAINYRHRSGSTKIDFRGTALLPEARGEAKVESKQGAIKIDADFDELQPATRFGPEYLTYVLWAVTPEGRPINLGEVLLDGKKSKLDVTTELQAFSLIVTAEPYFAVTRPSDVVVMENVVRKDTVGKVEEIEAKYELLQRGQYVVNVNPADLRPIELNPKVPLELFEARNALRIARWAGADRYASESFQKADQLLRQAEAYQERKAGRKPVAMTAREAAQTAEDARLIAAKRQEEERAAAERAATERAKAQAQEESRRRAQAEAEQRAEAERRARAEAEQKIETERRARAEAERATAEAERSAALAKQQAAQAEAERSRLAAEQAEKGRQKAEQEKVELRAQLLRQLNLILETRDTTRGLIVNMADVLFDTGKYSLRPGAREKLAKIAGIVLAHPGLKLEVEGHTDNVGGDEYNQGLSERRANAVRDYLIGQGVPPESITAHGFGKTLPVVSNDTAAGRQRNRRVELVVSGEVIGVQIGRSPQ